MLSNALSKAKNTDHPMRPSNEPNNLTYSNGETRQIAV